MFLKLRVVFLIIFLIFLSAFHVSALEKGTKYFNIIYEKSDEFYAQGISKKIDHIYTRINKDLGLVPKGRIDFYLCRTDEQFEKLYRGKPAKEIVGFARLKPDVLVAIKSPYLARGMDLQSVLAHELAHLVLRAYLKDKDIPRWLNEGFAMYESREMRINHYAIVASAAIRGDLLKLDELDYAFFAEGAKLELAYAQSYYLMSYIIGEFGPQRFRELIDAYVKNYNLKTAIEKALGISFEQFDKGWRASIRARYFVVSVIAYSSPVWIMVILAVIIYFRIKQRNRRIELKWQIEEMFEEKEEA
jgi:hypothetical protein